MASTSSTHRVLVVGGGSVGRRHLTNLRTLGVAEVAVVETRAERRTDLEKTLSVPTFASFPEALTAFAPTAAIVCTPPVTHVPIAGALIAAGEHVFMEKPLSHTLEGTHELVAAAAAAGKVLTVNYNLRFHPAVLKMKELLDAGRIGRLLYVHATCGQYLPDWHPYEDYRTWYMSKEAEGGGATLDLSHEIDYLRLLVGEVAELVAQVGTVSLDMDADDCVDMLLRFASGVRGHVHLDLLARRYERGCTLVGERGTISWGYVDQTVRVLNPGDGEPETHPVPVDMNKTFLDALAHFFDCIAGAQPRSSGEDARRTLQVALAAKHAARTGRAVSIDVN